MIHIFVQGKSLNKGVKLQKFSPAAPKTCMYVKCGIVVGGFFLGDPQRVQFFHPLQYFLFDTKKLIIDVRWIDEIFAHHLTCI